MCSGGKCLCKPGLCAEAGAFFLDASQLGCMDQTCVYLYKLCAYSEVGSM